MTGPDEDTTQVSADNLYQALKRKQEKPAQKAGGKSSYHAAQPSLPTQDIPSSTVTTPPAYLVVLAQAGDEEAFTTLFNYYGPGIGRHLAGLVNCAEDRDELAQDIFVRAWKKLPQLRDPTQFKSWLYSIATNIAYDYGRRQKRKRMFTWVPLEDADDLDSPKNLEENVIEEELVEQAWKEVPLKYRTCLLLEIEGELTHSEIAEVVGIHENSVRTYISHGRQGFLKAYHRLQKEDDTGKEQRSM